ncbi:hypothetical protein [Levilactobacillus brevis]|uniref:hypothetical protein n=1 Tax=Levilactobacillus brevis TaxID=1580 RepID=UPI00223E91EF|nr:hypothetical protein [Levilactobacillus brevis]
MATPNVGILTTAGKALIDKVNSGQAKISFSKIVFSSMDNSQLSDMQVKALTAIAPQEVVVSSPETTLDTNSGETRIRATGTNEKLADGVYVKTYGVFAKDDTGSEILYGVTVSPNPNYFPAYDGVTPQAVTYSYKTVIQETSNITMTNSNDVYASQEDLTEALQPYAKTVDVNQQLDKKVNISDMRKPASNVAGIEEVNAKQDKIAYTPADDSKVVHDNHDNTITANSLTYDLSKSGLTSLQLVNSGSFNDLPLGTVFAGTSMADGPDKNHTFTTTTFYFSGWSGRKAQIAIADNTNLMYFRVYMGINWTNWTLLSDDSKVVHTTDMRKPASDVAGIEEINAKQDKIGYTPADDSKVAHLSGANNFDTVPTVNNNPLLLASSLPSDLARTGSDQEFTGKNTFDTAPIDKTTGNPYITKDGVPEVSPTLADTTKDTNFTGKLQKSGIDVATKSDITTAVSTATANMVDSSKQTNFTAGLQSGGINVATAADLKSVEDAAWRQLDNKYITSDIAISSASTVLYKIDDTNKRLYLQGSVMLSSYGYDAITLHLDSIVNRVLTVTGSYLGRISAYQNWTNITADSSLTFNPQSGLVQFSGDNYSPLESKGPLYITYDKLV